MIRSIRLIIAITVYVILAVSGLGQTASEGFLRFTVTTKDREPVRGLSADNFKVSSGKVVYTVFSVTGADEPATIGILVDTSKAIDKKLAPFMLDAAARFVDGLSGNNELFVMSIGNKPQLAADYSTDKTTIKKAIAELSMLPRTSGTMLYGSIDEALTKIKTSRFRKKALVVFTNGFDGTFYEKPMEWCVPIYSLGTIGSMFRENYRRYKTLEWLTASCGGRPYVFEKGERMVERAQQIAKVVEGQYVLGFKYVSRAPAKRRNGELMIDVKLMPSKGKEFAEKPVITLPARFYEAD